VPGITIPDRVRAAMHDAGERGAEVGMELAQGFLLDVLPQIQGTYIMPSFGRYEMAAELVRRIRAEQPAPAPVADTPSRERTATPVAGT